MKTSIIQNKYLRALLVLAFYLLIWQAAAMLVGNELLLASPLVTVQRLVALLGTSKFYIVTAASLVRILLGLVFAVLAGCVLAVLSERFQVVDMLIRPLMTIIKSTPVASFIILTLVWMYTGQIPAFMTFLMVLPIVWGNVSQGIHSTDPQLLEMARVYQLGSFQTLRHIYLPSVMPYFLSACTSGIGLGWKAGIAAEIICLPRDSIGFYLNRAKVTLETGDLFAWTITVILISLLLEKLFVKAARRLGRRYNAG